MVWHHQREEKIAFCSIWQSQFPCYLFPCIKATVLWQYFYEQKHKICGNFEELKLQFAFGKCFSYFDGLKVLRTSWKVLLYGTMSNVCWQIFDLRDGGQQGSAVFLSAKIFAKTFSKPFSWYFFNTQLWFTKPCIFVLNKCSLKWADWKRLINSNSKQEMTNNDVIICQYISTLKNKTFTMVTSHPWLRKRSNFVMRRGPTCINHPCYTYIKWSYLYKHLHLHLQMSKTKYKKWAYSVPFIEAWWHNVSIEIKAICNP